MIPTVTFWCVSCLLYHVGMAYPCAHAGCTATVCYPTWTAWRQRCRQHRPRAWWRGVGAAVAVLLLWPALAQAVPFEVYHSPSWACSGGLTPVALVPGVVAGPLGPTCGNPDFTGDHMHVYFEVRLPAQPMPTVLGVTLEAPWYPNGGYLYGEFLIGSITLPLERATQIGFAVLLLNACCQDVAQRALLHISLGDQSQDYAVDILHPTPEPGTLALLGSALAGVGWVARRKQAPRPDALERSAPTDPR